MHIFHRKGSKSSRAFCLCGALACQASLDSFVKQQNNIKTNLTGGRELHTLGLRVFLRVIRLYFYGFRTFTAQIDGLVDR